MRRKHKKSSVPDWDQAVSKPMVCFWVCLFVFGFGMLLLLLQGC